MKVKHDKLGFAMLEVMVSVAVIASLGLGIYRVQVAELNAAQLAITRQSMLQAATNIAAQIYAHLNYTAATSTSLSGGYSSACGNTSCYAEASYTNHTQAPTRDCSSVTCSDMDYADYILYRWKQSFNNMNMPAANIQAIVCADSNAAAPSLSSPNCSNGALVVKIIWQNHLLDAESSNLSASNYIVLRVPAR